VKFSAKGEYGIRAILDIALRGEQGPVQVKEIARRQCIPERFLEQVMASLKKSGLVKSIRGARGGYLLTKAPEQISLADIIQALEGPLSLMKCTSDETPQHCDQFSLCVIRDIWKDVQSSILEALDSITVADICKRMRQKEGSLNYMYHI